MMTPTDDYQTARIDVPPRAGKILLDLALVQAQAQLRLNIAIDVARAMANAPQDWELRVENGQVFFAAPKADAPASLEPRA